jgi:TRAP-type C4-dicarboxylate transport system permease small subunit
MLRLVSAIVMALFCLMLIGPSWQFTEIGSIQTSPALGWRMDFVHVSTLIAAISLLAYSLLRIVGMLRGTTDGLPDQAHMENT